MCVSARQWVRLPTLRRMRGRRWPRPLTKGELSSILEFDAEAGKADLPDIDVTPPRFGEEEA